MSTRSDNMTLTRSAIAAVVHALVLCTSVFGAEPVAADRRESDFPQSKVIIELLDRDVESAIEAANALKATDEAPEQVSRLVAELKSAWLADRSVVWIANCVTLLEKLAANPDAAALLVRMLEDQRPEVRQAALEAAIRCNAVEEPRILPLIVLLHHGEPSQRFESARLLGKFGRRAVPAADSLIRAATDETMHVSVRWEAVFALRAMGRVGGQALGEVVAMSEKAVAYKALDSLAALGADAEPAYATVVNAIGNSDSQIRARAAVVLGTLDSKAEESLPKLRVLLDDPDSHVRVAARDAIKRLESLGQNVDPRARFDPR